MKQFTAEQISELKDIAIFVADYKVEEGSRLSLDELPGKVQSEFLYLQTVVHEILTNGWVALDYDEYFSDEDGLRRWISLEYSETLDVHKPKEKFKHLDNWIEVDGKKIHLDLSSDEFGKLRFEEMCAVLDESGSRI